MESAMKEVQAYFNRAAALSAEVANSNIPKLAFQAGEIMSRSLSTGSKVMFCGNGGSAADAQHLAAEFTGHLIKDRIPLAGLALTTDTSALTAIANDYNYNDVFARQVEALGRAGDTLICISTSGKSANIVAAAAKARDMGINVIALVGPGKCPLDDIATIVLHLPGENAGLIQQGHITAGHTICAVAEREFL